MSTTKRYHVRSRETRVVDWYVVAASAGDAREWVYDQCGDIERAESDQFDSTEIIDVTEVINSECRNVAP
jgi:alkylhydroperoxidase family enzyme